MTSSSLIKLLPLIGLSLGLLLGETTRPTFLMMKVPLPELLDLWSSSVPADQNIAKQQLIHIGTYGLIGAVIGFVLSVVLKKHNSEDK